MPEFDEDELHEISIYDFVPQTVSVFAQFLMDKNNLKVILKYSTLALACYI